MKQQIEFIQLNKLKLDSTNPRLPSSFHNKSESDIIKWMLEDESIIELMLAIGQHDFFIGEALLVVKNGSDFTVVEGNRRLTSLKLLSNSSLATIRESKVKQVLDETTKRPNLIPCIVFDNKEQIMQYLGYRHVTGIKSWSVASKAKYLHSLLSTLESQGLTDKSRELAKKIGSKTDYVKKLLVGYKVYEIIKDNSFYKIPQLNETTFHFNYITASLQRTNIREFINIEAISDIDNLENLGIKKDNLKTLIDWFFRKNDQNKSRVLGDNDNLTKLNNILPNPEIIKKFKDGLSLKESNDLINISEEFFTQGLSKSLNELKRVKEYSHKLNNYGDDNLEILKEIVALCKEMKVSISSKQGEWEL